MYVRCSGDIPIQWDLPILFTCKHLMERKKRKFFERLVNDDRGSVMLSSEILFVNNT